MRTPRRRTVFMVASSTALVLLSFIALSLPAQAAKESGYDPNRMPWWMQGSDVDEHVDTDTARRLHGASEGAVYLAQARHSDTQCAVLGRIVTNPTTGEEKPSILVSCPSGATHQAQGTFAALGASDGSLGLYLPPPDAIDVRAEAQGRSVQTSGQPIVLTEIARPTPPDAAAERPEAPGAQDTEAESTARTVITVTTDDGRVFEVSPPAGAASPPTG